MIAFDRPTNRSVWPSAGARDYLGGDISRCPRVVLDDELLAESFRKPLCRQSGDDVISAASGKAYDQVHRPRRIIQRQRDARCDRQRGSADCQMQKFSAGKFHG